MSKYHQGTFKPKNPNKYVGDVTNIYYRSGWERKFYNWLDIESTVLQWSSEELIVPYVSPKDGRLHRYFPDAWAKMQTRKGLQCFLIEIKPFAQTHVPKTPKRRTKRYLNEVMTYAVNDAKWQAARQFCSDKGWEFKIITEKELYGIKK